MVAHVIVLINSHVIKQQPILYPKFLLIPTLVRKASVYSGQWLMQRLRTDHCAKHKELSAGLQMGRLCQNFLDQGQKKNVRMGREQ